MSNIRNKKLNNSGNTFVVVMVGLACMGILIGVILASAGYFYRMRYVDLENKNNFYYVEKAMDELYAGIGSDYPPTTIRLKSWFIMIRQPAIM